MFYGFLLSLHLAYQQNYNWIHPFVGMHLTDKVIVGAYYNSERKVSTYIAYSSKLLKDTKLEIGLVSGYSTAAIQPMLKLTYKNIFITPSTETINNITKPKLIVGLEWRY